MKRLVVCALLVGCADDDSGSGSPIAIEDLGMRLAEVSCQKVFDCCTDAEIMTQFMNVKYMGEPVTTEAQCVAFTAGFFNGLALPQWQASIAAGRMEYDASAAGGCVSASASLSCSEYAALSSGGGRTSLAGTCQPFLIPKVATDGACSQDDECTSDNCVKTSSSTDGTCKALPVQGRPATAVASMAITAATPAARRWRPASRSRRTARHARSMTSASVATATTRRKSVAPRLRPATAAESRGAS